MELQDRNFRNDQEAAGEVESSDERGKWSRHTEFLLAAIGYAVGLGSVWRFPYLCQKNGGGAFIVLYLVCLNIVGISTFGLELGIGQCLRRGSIACWNEISPYLGGVGIAGIIVSFLVSIYYNMVIGWSFYYMFVTIPEKLSYGRSAQVDTHMSDDNGLYLAIGLLLLYCIVTKLLGATRKVLSITLIFPCLVLFLFLIRGLTLEGAAFGIKKMFKPDFKYLLEPVAWIDAATQVFFSLSLAFGGLVSMASYNPVHNNFCRDSIIVPLVNCFTSLLASIVVFAVLGFKATQVCNAEGNPCDVEKEYQSIASGAGLTFIAFTEAITQMPAPHFWAILFLVMLMMFGFATILLGVVAPLFDTTISVLKKVKITVVICVVACVVGMIFCQRSGTYWLEVFNGYSAAIPLHINVLIELIAVSWFFDIDKFIDCIHRLTGRRPGKYWIFSWKYVAPGSLCLIIVFFLAHVVSKGTNAILYERFDEITLHKIRTLVPDYRHVLGTLLMMLPSCTVFGVAICTYFEYTTRVNEEVEEEGDDEDRCSLYKRQDHGVLAV